MEEIDKKEKRSQGDHLPPGVVQADIIMYILSQNEAVPATKIRDHLKNKYVIRDRKNIKRHYGILKRDGCIKIVSKGGGEDSNIWDITKTEHLRSITKKIKEEKIKEKKNEEEACFKNIELNKYEKSINIIIRDFGYDKKSPEYTICFILIYNSPSFFDMCLETDIKLLISKALKMYCYGAGYEDESRIEELLNECNAAYIKGKLNFVMLDERFREVMEELALEKEKILEEYAWRIWRDRPELRTEQEKEKFMKLFSMFDSNPITDIVNNFHNFTLDEIKTKEWIESFFEMFKRIVPELSEILIETVMITPDEYKEIYLEINELLSLMEKQQKIFKNTCFILLFEHFLSQDILKGIDLPEELNFAKKIKNLGKELYDSLAKKDLKAIQEAINRSTFDEHKIISEFMAKHKMPSILSNISDDSKEVLRELLTLHNHKYLLEYMESHSVE
jgi:hypothetical protein